MLMERGKLKDFWEEQKLSELTGRIKKIFLGKGEGGRGIK